MILVLILVPIVVGSRAKRDCLAPAGNGTTTIATKIGTTIRTTRIGTKIETKMGGGRTDGSRRSALNAPLWGAT